MKQIKELKKTLKIINVSVNATQQLWKAKALGTKYFQYNVSRTNESNSYSSMSNRTKWQNNGGEVPPNEPAGIKQSNLTFIAELTSLTKR